MKGNKGITRIYKAFLNSISGICFALKKEAAFRQDCILVIIAFLSFFAIDVSKLDVVIMIFASAILLISELLNSAVEWNVDLTTQEIHPFAKAAKDLASAAVFVALVLFCLAYISIFF